MISINKIGCFTNSFRSLTLRVLEITAHPNRLVVKVIGSSVPSGCPACAHALYRHGSQSQHYIDIPVRGKRVILEIDRKRFRCKSCGKTLFEPLPDIDDRRHMTRRLVKYIEVRSVLETFSRIAREVGVDDKTIRHIFDDYVTRSNELMSYQMPESLGIEI